MGKGWKELLQGDGNSTPKEKRRLIMMILCGVLLFIIASPTKGGLLGLSGNEQGTRDPVEGRNGITQGGENIPAGTTSDLGGRHYAAGAGGNLGTDLGSYVESLEKRLSERLSQITGVGPVEVMISLQSSAELVVEKEQSAQRNTTNETDAEGGKRTASEHTTQESTVYASEGSTKSPLIVKTIVPQVEGVLVVAKGAGSGNVNRTIVEIVQALFGLEAHKVKVVKME